MAQQSYAKSVLDKALEIAAAKGETTAGDVSSAMFAQTRTQHKRVLNILSEHARDGRLHRIRQGVYGPLPKDDSQPQPDKREIMWRLLRMRRRVMVADLMEMAGASKEYAREWLRMLEKNEVVRKEQAAGFPGEWILINDTVTMPEDSEKAGRLRKLRRSRLSIEISRQLDAIDQAVSSIRRKFQEEEEI